MTLSVYLDLLTQQRDKYPAYAKYHYTNPLISFVKTAEETAQDLIRNPQARYVNTIETVNPLYDDTEDFLYFEFVDTSLVTGGTLSDWKYWYIPVSYKDRDVNGTPFLEQIPELPFIYHYDAYREVVEKRYPFKPFVYSLARPASYNFAEPLVSHVHPFSSSFIFTGNYYLAPHRNKYIYEYVDYFQVSEYIYTIHMSDIAPVGFFPLSYRLSNASLVEGNLAEGNPPVRLTWSEDRPDFRSTGRITNSTFSPKYIWFEYVIYIDDQPQETVLLPHQPTTLSLTYVDVFTGRQIGHNFPLSTNIQSVKYKQVSTNNKIVIKP